MIRTAKAIESKIKIRSIPVEHLHFMGVHDAAHANIEGGASQQGHLSLAVHASVTNCRVPVSGTELAEQENQEGCPQQCKLQRQTVCLPARNILTGCAQCGHK